MLPQEFVLQTRYVMGQERFERYLRSFSEEPPVSIRLNPLKTGSAAWKVDGAEPVPWCETGYYLRQRAPFTFDPLFHCGCYYVQEAASMFLSEILRQTAPQAETALDLCAAPGGKTTLLRSLLPESCVLYSNEPVRNRASVLVENVAKWGYGLHYVTNGYAKDYLESGLTFDVVLCDVPCSGEGMFRRDEATIGEWSPQAVAKCQRLQREILTDAWRMLNDGGLLIYSTCTFNIKENEENIAWLLSEHSDAGTVKIDVEEEWHVTGSLMEGFHEPVYRFIPGISRSEGLFVCVLRKSGSAATPHVREKERKKTAPKASLHIVYPDNKRAAATPQALVPLSYADALRYLRGEALTLPYSAPRGIVGLTFQGHILGQAKNIGSRANNLYPKEWRIRTAHLPNEYEAILIPA